MDKEDDKMGGAEGSGADGSGAEGSGAEDEVAGVEDEVAGAGDEVAGAGAYVARARADVAGAAGGNIYTAVVNNLSDLYLESTSNNKENTYTEPKPLKLNVSGLYKGFIDPSIFTDNLTYLNFEHNELVEVPAALLALKNIVHLDLSHNSIKYFDEAPMFINKLEELSLSDNSLLAPPSWIWKKEPRNLKCLNLSNNQNIVSTLKEQGRKEFFYCWINIYKLIMYNCRLHTCTDILYTFTGIRELILGGGDSTTYSWNEMYEFPMEFLNCSEARVINLNNCKIYDIHPNITSYNSVSHLDIGMNYIVYLPDELGHLTELEVLIMSFNKLESLPKSMLKLTKLRMLLIDNNRIEHFPGNSLKALPKLKCLDMYENCFNILPEGHEALDQFDAAQNYFREPEEIPYVQKRSSLRTDYTTYAKINGNKYKPVYEVRNVRKPNEGSHDKK